MKLLRELKKALFEQSQFANFLLSIKCLDKKRSYEELKKEIPIFPYRSNSPYNKVYNSFMKRPLILQEFYKKIQKDTTSNIDLAMDWLSMITAFYYTGQKIIKVKNESLIFQLENTDITKLRYEDIKIPFDFFYVDITRNIENIITIDGAFVNKEDGYLSLEVLFESKIYNRMVMTIILDNEKDIESSIKDSIKHYLEEVKLQEKDENATFDYYENIITILFNYTTKIVLNLIVFYNMIVNNKGNKSYFLEEKNTTIKNNITVNKKNISYIADANYYYILSNNSYNNQKIEEELKAKKKIEKQFLVSGHMRKQPYGKKGEIYYKNIWIEPYLKGLDYNIDNKMKINVL